MLPTISDYKSEIKLKFGELGPIMRWCQINCVGEWAYQMMRLAGEEQGEYEFYFSNKADYINFNLFKK
jgi:hypothetical protein